MDWSMFTTIIQESYLTSHSMLRRHNELLLRLRKLILDIHLCHREKIEYSRRMI